MLLTTTAKPMNEKYLEAVSDFLHKIIVMSMLGNACQQLLAFEMYTLGMRYVKEGKVEYINMRLEPVMKEISDKYDLEDSGNLLSSTKQFKAYLEKRNLAFSLCHVYDPAKYLPTDDPVELLKRQNNIE